jgi:hypothetical protein
VEALPERPRVQRAAVRERAGARGIIRRRAPVARLALVLRRAAAQALALALALALAALVRVGFRPAVLVAVAVAAWPALRTP